MNNKPKTSPASLSLSIIVILVAVYALMPAIWVAIGFGIVLFPVYLAWQIFKALVRRAQY